MRVSDAIQNKVLLYLKDQPDSSRDQIAEGLGYHFSTINRALDKLIDQNSVYGECDGHGSTWFAAEAL